MVKYDKAPLQLPTDLAWPGYGLASSWCANVERHYAAWKKDAKASADRGRRMRIRAALRKRQQPWCEAKAKDLCSLQFYQSWRIDSNRQPPVPKPRAWVPGLRSRTPDSQRKTLLSRSLRDPSVPVPYLPDLPERIRLLPIFYYLVKSLIDGAGADDIVGIHAILLIDEVQWTPSQAVRALWYVHGEGVVHRDVKLANIVITVRSDAVLTDFGIAKANESPRSARTAAELGTPES